MVGTNIALVSNMTAKASLIIYIIAAMDSLIKENLGKNSGK